LRPEALARWLLSERMSHPDGWVMSWYNGNGTGFSYPEASAYVLSAASTMPEFFKPDVSGRLNEIAHALIGAAAASGGIGKDGRIHLFDTALAADALGRWAAHRGMDEALDSALAQLAKTIQRMAQKRISVTGERLPERWSTQVGPYLLKIVQGILAIPDESRPEGFLEHMSAFFKQLTENGHLNDVLDRRLPADPMYTHSLCYALEGLARCQDAGLLSPRSLEGAADVLCELQRPDGGMPRFTQGDSEETSPMSDSTAQSMRLWMLIDRSRYKSNIGAASEFLERIVDIDGPRYTIDSEDRTSWSAVFYMQVLHWLSGEASIRELI